MSDVVLSIHPRLIIVPNGLETSEFMIKNYAKDDTLLLFKIHRSEPKLVSYNPKKGIVEPGHQAAITLKFIDPKITLARILVKIVEIDRSKLGASFNVSWNIGSKSLVKKVVEIRNATYCLSSEAMNMSFISESFRTPSEKDFDPLTISSRSSGFSPYRAFISPTNAPKISTPIGNQIHPPSSGHFWDSDPSAARSISSPHGKDSQSSSQSQSHHRNIQINNSNNNSNNSNSNSSARITAPPLSDIDSVSSEIQKIKGNFADESAISTVLESILKNLGKDQKESIDVGAKSLLMGLGMGLSASLGSRGGGILSKSTREEIDGEDEETKEEMLNLSLHSVHSNHRDSSQLSHSREGLVDKNKYDVKKCSRLSVLSSSHEIVSLLLTIQGPPVDNKLVVNVMKLRLLESILSEQRISALEISNCHRVNSISKSISRVFELDSDKGKNVNVNNNEADIEEDQELAAMRGVILRDNLRHLIVTSTSISEIDPSLNHFMSLTHIDLSQNNIRCLTGTLHLPHLSYLNLSRNKLVSLDFIQELVSLKTLLVSSNELSTFKTSVNVLVPLAGSLQVLDMSFNPICANLRYAEHVLSVLPFLKYFDAKDLDALRDYYDPKPLMVTSSSISAVSVPTSLRSTTIKKLQKSGFMKMNQTIDMDDEFTQRLKRAVRRQKLSPRKDGTQDSLSKEKTELNLSNHHHHRRRKSDPELSSDKLKAPTVPESHHGKRYLNSSMDSGTIVSDNHSIHKILRNISPSSTLLDLTDSMKLRRRYFGMSLRSSTDKQQSKASAYDDSSSSIGHSTSKQHSEKGYQSDGDPFTSLHNRGRKSSRAFTSLTPDQMRDMQEEDKYRVPRANFGFSKPFKDRPNVKPSSEVPLFDKVVHRLRDGFEKSPVRGTFPRAARGIGAEWYPMDIDDITALKRRGYFDSNIGDISRNSYKDKKSTHSTQSRDLNKSSSTLLSNTSMFAEGEVSFRSNGSVVIHPQQSGRKITHAAHVSRLYNSEESFHDDTRYTRPEDQFSDYRKWHPELYSDHMDSTNPPPLPYDHLSPANKSSSPRRNNLGSDQYTYYPEGNTTLSKSPFKSWSDLDSHMSKNHTQLSQRKIRTSPTNNQNRGYLSNSPNPSQSKSPPKSPPKSSSKPIYDPSSSTQAIMNKFSSVVIPNPNSPSNNSPKLNEISTQEKLNLNSISPKYQSSSEGESELLTYLKWLEDQQNPSNTIHDESHGKDSKRENNQEEDMLAGGDDSKKSTPTKTMSPSPSKVPRPVRRNSGEKRPLPPSHVPMTASHTTTSLSSRDIGTPSRGSRLPVSSTRSRSKSPGSRSLLDSVKANPHPYDIPGEDPTLESKFTSHDLEYTPSHPRDAAMKPEMLDIDQTFASTNPLKNLMISNNQP